MFNNQYGLQRAAIDGTKPMTRRLCKDSATGEVILAKDVDSVRLYPDSIAEFVMKNGDVRCSVPQYQVGEVVAIAQNYQEAINEFNRLGDISGWGNLIANTENGCAGYYNKMFVRADLMPHRIRITDIKIERLQDISEEDAMREGVFKYDKPPLHHECDMFAPWPPYIKPYKWDANNLIYRCTARYAFAYLIDKVNGRGTWDSNPYCFCYEFKLVK